MAAPGELVMSHVVGGFLERACEGFQKGYGLSSTVDAIGQKWPENSAAGRDGSTQMWERLGTTPKLIQSRS